MRSEASVRGLSFSWHKPSKGSITDTQNNCLTFAVSAWVFLAFRYLCFFFFPSLCYQTAGSGRHHNNQRGNIYQKRTAYTLFCHQPFIFLRFLLSCQSSLCCAIKFNIICWKWKGLSMFPHLVLKTELFYPH